MKIFVVVTSTLICLVFGEIALRYLTVFPITQTSNTAQDPRLGYRMSTSLPDVDGHGFRNKEATYESFEIAAIGDSFTYSFHVNSEDSWPAVFGRLTGLKTYNFGVGSYNLFSHHAIIENIVEKDIKGIIIALYPTNDFEQKFKYCYDGGDFEFWEIQVTKLQLMAPTSLDECGIVERKEKREGISFPSLAITSAIKNLIIDKIRAYAVRSKTIIGAQIFINNIKYTLGIDAEDKFFRFPEDFPPLNKKKIRQVTEWKRSDVPEMLPNFEKLARDWQRSAQRHGIELGVVIIPAREQVTYALLERRGILDQADPEFRDLVEWQNQLDQLIENVLDEIGIANVNALNELVRAMQEAMEAGHNFYPARDDHPLEDGYRVIAQAAQRLWQMLSN